MKDQRMNIMHDFGSDNDGIEEYKRSPRRLHPTDESGRTPLHDAAKENDVQTIAALLNAGADINEQDEDGWTPLHCAVSWECTDAIDLLIKCGANVNTKDKYNDTPLHSPPYESAQSNNESATVFTQESTSTQKLVAGTIFIVTVFIVGIIAVAFAIIGALASAFGACCGTDTNTKNKRND